MVSWIVRGVLAAGFLACALLQWNDPDPLGWLAIYGAAAVACVLPRRRAAALAPLAVALAAIAWAVDIGVGGFRAASWREIAGDMQMKTTAVEEARELLGLILVALVMTALAGWFVIRRRAWRT